MENRVWLVEIHFGVRGGIRKVEPGAKVLKYSAFFCGRCKAIKKSRCDQIELREIAWGKNHRGELISKGI